MLVLSLKRNESIMIGDIPIMVVEIRGDKVRLGIDAPWEVPVHRREIYDAIRRGERPQPHATHGDRNGNGRKDNETIHAQPVGALSAGIHS